MEHLFLRQIDDSGECRPSTIKRRVFGLEKAALFLTVNTTFCDYYHERRMLEEINTDFAESVREEIEEQSKNWKAEAINWIKDCDASLWPEFTDDECQLESQSQQSTENEFSDPRMEARLAKLSTETPVIQSIETELQKYDTITEDEFNKCKFISKKYH